MKQFNISIPEKKDFMRWAEILRFRLSGGFSCIKCGAKSGFDETHFKSEVNGLHLMVSNSTRGICADCTIHEMNEKSDVVFTEIDCKCDWCSNPKATTSFPRHQSLESIIFIGGMWWNGHHICQDCMNIGFRKRGPCVSSVHEYVNSKMYYKNRLGLRINPE